MDVSLGSVKTLALDHNLITQLNDNVQLDRVVMFNISNNKLQSISDNCLKSMRQLTKLSLANNCLTHLPDSICKLNYLTQLDCRHNSLKELPSGNKNGIKSN